MAFGGVLAFGIIGSVIVLMLRRIDRKEREEQHRDTLAADHQPKLS